MLAPVRTPNSLRDFLAFRDHVERGAARRGTPVPEPWDRIPVYYKGNRRSIIGPGEEVLWPSYTQKLDYECEVAAVVGRGGRDIPAEEADAYVFGYTIMNDWSARDIQKDEMACWLGPAKAKDFATTLGPWLVTPDEWSRRTTRDDRAGERRRGVVAGYDGRAGAGRSREMLAWAAAGRGRVADRRARGRARSAAAAASTWTVADARPDGDPDRRRVSAASPTPSCATRQRRRPPSRYARPHSRCSASVPPGCVASRSASTSRTTSSARNP